MKRKLKINVANGCWIIDSSADLLTLQTAGSEEESRSLLFARHGFRLDRARAEGQLKDAIWLRHEEETRKGLRFLRDQFVRDDAAVFIEEWRE